MKKIISIFTVIVLLFSLMAFTASAETNSKEWTRLTGPASFEITPDGTSVIGAEGVSFYKYTKNKVDVTDFTCTFTLEQDNYWNGHDGDHNYYYSILLTNKAAHSGSQGLFLLMFPTSGSSLRLEGQILNTGFLLSPSYVEVDVSTTEPITMHGKVVNGNYYEISFDNCKQTYKFEIPVNYQFHKDLDGEGYFGFGATINESDETAKITVSSVNGIEMTGTEVAETDTASGSDSGSTSSNLTAPQSDSTQGTTSVDSSLFIILIIAVVVMFVVIVAGFVAMILILNKKLTK